MLLTARLPPAVDPRVSGTEVVSAAELEKKLGRWPLHVWRVLCHLRDSAGLCHATLAGIGRSPKFEPTPHWRVLAAMRRLKQAGLVEPLGWQVHTVPIGTERADRMVFFRRIRGAPLLSVPGQEKVAVPATCTAWLAAARSRGRPWSTKPPKPKGPWGGVRSGAGHPLSSAGKDATKSLSSAGKDATKSPFQVGVKTLPPSLSSGSKDATKSGKDATTSCFQVEVKTLPRHREENKREILSTGFPLSGETSAPVGALLNLRLERGEDGPVVVPGDIEGTRRQLAPMLDTPQPGVPAFPRLEVARVPHPPLLDPDAHPDELALSLARAYRGAIEKRTGKRCFQLTGTEPRTWKSFATLVAGGRVLAEHEIAPAAWCAWSCDVWGKYGDKGVKPGKARSAPPVAWVFGVKRIEERRGWFRSEEGSYEGGRIVHGPKQKELMWRYARMHHALGERGVDVRAVVDDFFPGELYAELLAAAKGEAAEYRALLTRQAREGAFLW